MTKQGHLEPEIYSDSNWTEVGSDRRSTTRYATMMSGAVITWKSKRQTTVATSTAEAAKDATWIRNIFRSMNFKVKIPMSIYSDNNGSKSIAENPVHHHRTKHIDIRYHFIREKVKKGIADIVHMDTQEMLADTFTKNLGRVVFERLRDKKGLVAWGQTASGYRIRLSVSDAFSTI